MVQFFFLVYVRDSLLVVMFGAVFNRLLYSARRDGKKISSEWLYEISAIDRLAKSRIAFPFSAVHNWNESWIRTINNAAFWKHRRLEDKVLSVRMYFSISVVYYKIPSTFSYVFHVVLVVRLRSEVYESSIKFGKVFFCRTLNLFYSVNNGTPKNFAIQICPQKSKRLIKPSWWSLS